VSATFFFSLVFFSRPVSRTGTFPLIYFSPLLLSQIAASKYDNLLFFRKSTLTPPAIRKTKPLPFSARLFFWSAAAG